MIDKLVQSALATGCLSVESEGLLRQLIAVKTVKPADRQALEMLQSAMQEGHVTREARHFKDSQRSTPFLTSDFGTASR
ncbi:hypothetical protein ACQ4M4_01895 [Leptolyngbya sp. AN02str]|uniref:hypothetical protein n=1 Tax=Leptolyngbya sp. AN02str TaxID=3423363 RepID=UPI003D317022